MPTSNQELFDAYIRHQTYILRTATWLRNQASKILAAGDPALGDLILATVARMENVELSSQTGQRMMRDFEEKLIKLRREPWGEVADLYDENLIRIATSEVAWAAATFQQSVPVLLDMKTVPPAQMRRIVRANPYQGRTMSEWLTSAAGTESAEILRRTKVGIADGMQPRDVARSVLGAASEGGAGGTTIRSMQHAETIAITLTNGITSEAREQFYVENTDVINTEIFLATLDGNTTPECVENDQELYKVGEGPMPPLHPRCRSLRIPYADAELLGNRPFKPTTEGMLIQEYAEANGLKSNLRKRDSLPRGHKGKFDEYARGRTRELIGQVEGRTPYPEWFGTQSAAFKSDYLGPSRYAIYKDLSEPKQREFMRSLSNQFGRPYTVDQLESQWG
ncbi:minor head protein-like protein [Vibrio phage VpKK5]|uniref:head morphogenesis n=1 Tax=Vibrio phage VpKK5 TaxID=1538804 RepID=UPI0004F70A82|nr:head morphogenesis [Vibrio phage VpKK5]AIM40560.1 minor head protein-like protein [Vibrio phage VpKK5]